MLTRAQGMIPYACCMTSVLFSTLATCPGCDSRPAGPAGLCPSCLSGMFQAVHHPGLLALGPFDGALASAVRAFKFRGVTRLAQPLALELAGQVRQRGWQPSAVTSVPLHPARLRERGYNQAELLARACAAKLGVPWLELLERPARTVQQARLATHQRAANTGNAFTLASSAPRVLPARILILDDVLTTGATLGACRKVLLAGGAQHVWSAAVALASPRQVTDAARAELKEQPAETVFAGQT